MYIKRSKDVEEIKKILHNLSAIANSSDVEGVPPIPIHDLIHYILVYDDQHEVVGCYTLIPHNVATVDIHTNLLPKGYGEVAAAAIPLILSYVFNTVGWSKLVSEVPSFNRLALRYIRLSRMKLEGTLSQAFLKDNTLYDIFVYGMTKEEYKCLSQSR